MWLGILINFVSLSLIGYYFGYNLTKALILPYGLQYLFMLNGPVYGTAFIKRLVALAFGAVLIMISKFIVHRKKVISLMRKVVLLFLKEIRAMMHIRILIS